jgi:hypothetical protein
MVGHAGLIIYKYRADARRLHDILLPGNALYKWGWRRGCSVMLVIFLPGSFPGQKQVRPYLESYRKLDREK